MASFSDLKSYVSKNNISSNPNNNSSGKAYKAPSGGGSGGSNTKPLANGGSMSLQDFGTAVNQMGIATPNWSPTTGLNATGQASLNKLLGSPINTTDLTTPVPKFDIPQPKLYEPTTAVVSPFEDTTVQDQSALSNAKLVADFMGDAQPERLDRAKIEKESGLTSIKTRVNNLASEIGNLQAQNQADIQLIRNQSSTEGGTIGILSAREDATNRSYAAKILPLNAQYQSELGNQQMAQDLVNTYIADENAYQDRLYSYKKDLGNMFLSAMNTDQQRRWELQDQANANARDDAKSNNSWKLQAWEQATANGQTSLASKILGLDSSSANFMTDLENYTSRLSTPVGSNKAPTIQEINGVDMQWDGQKWVTPNGVTASTNIQRLAGTKATVDQITNITEGSGLSSTVGTSFLSQTPTGNWFTKSIKNIIKFPATLGVGTVKDLSSTLTGQRQDFIADVEQVRSNLNLEKLISSKAQGATFGALSDNELRVLASAGTKLGTWAQKDKDGNVVGYNASEKAFKAELDKINSLTKLDYILKGGEPIDVGVIVNNDGTYWVKNSDGTFTQIM